MKLGCVNEQRTNLGQGRQAVRGLQARNFVIRPLAGLLLLVSVLTEARTRRSGENFH
jgi:hypothetical protein